MIGAIYTRVSTDQQAEKGYSIDTQLDACHKRASELGLLQVEEFIDDGYSGAYLERPNLDRLREGIRNKRYSHVIVYDPDRLSRNLTHQLILTDEIEANGAKLIFINFEWENTPEGKLFYSMRGAISAYEREKTRERSMRGKRGKAMAGKVIRNNKPYGYDWDPVNSVYIINDQEAKMVRQIFGWYVNQHMGIRAIASRLAELNYPTRTDRKSWNMGTVRDILKRETYAGTHWSNKYYKVKVGQNKNKRGVRNESEWIPVTVPAIVSREMWEAAQRRFILNRHITKQPMDYPYLCRTLVICAVCGTPMKAIVSGTKHRPYYMCKTGKAASGKASLLGATEKCPARFIPAEELDNSVWEYVSNLLRNPELLKQELMSNKESKEDTTSLQSNLKRLNDQENELLKERERITLLFRKSLIEIGEAEKQLGEIKQSLTQIQSSRKALERELSVDLSNNEQALVTTIEEFSTHADIDDPVQRRNIILRVVKSIKAQRIDKGYAVNKEPEIEAEIEFVIK